MSKPAEAIAAVTQPDVKAALKSSWGLLAPNKKKYGVELMCKLFSLHKDTARYFERMGKLDANNAGSNRELIGHAIYLMYAIESFVDQLDDPSIVEDIGRNFAYRHLKRGIGSKSFSVILDTLDQFLGDSLGVNYTAEVKDAWEKLVKVILALLDDEKK
uniref:Hemoglobin (Heterodimeric) n=1 Tax=Barbatia virescens TaxID=6559 RepID=Q17286_9BIVA|nr:hemoglobin (heterodimeric) [Barbatia virescens]